MPLVLPELPELDEPPEPDEEPPLDEPPLDWEAGVLDLPEPLEELPQPTATNATKPRARIVATVAILCLRGLRVDTIAPLCARLRTGI
jgi:hypothetical protein